jgi:glycosyltransferase involved in cell wall biosynthesis
MEMESPLISVIVPVYNIENYVRKCVGGIMEQTYKNIEIILVDDGSTDACPAICDELAETDARIKVLHTPNGDISVARNVGIKASRGDYITFIDGDDYVTPDYTLHLYELVKEYRAEISITSYCIQSEGAGQIQITKKPAYILVMNRHEALETYLYQKHFITSAWGRLFHRSLFSELEFPAGKVAEDQAIFYKLLDKAERVVYSSVIDYIYVQRSSSITHMQKDRMKNDSLEFLEEMKRYVTTKYPDLSDAVTSRCFKVNVYCLKYIPFRELYRKKHASIRADIIKYRRSVLANGAVPLKIRSAALFSYFGIWFLSIVFAVYNGIDSARG